ncbi:MAG: hypothetical protein OXC72_01640 [Roseovarius sp.]|nr:hypothetical protein [Roseovarius sp.]MCY4290449.1 hypothetical protein [Roseovarius sp.]
MNVVPAVHGPGQRQIGHGFAHRLEMRASGASRKTMSLPVVRKASVHAATRPRGHLIEWLNVLSNRVPPQISFRRPFCPLTAMQVDLGRNI